MSTPGMFCGIGVGPGEPGLIPVIAWEFLKRCDVIFVPRATTKDHSAARRCLPSNEIPDERFRQVEFTMDSNRDVLCEQYATLAETIAAELRAGKDIAYLTIGDPFSVLDLHLHACGAQGLSAGVAASNLSRRH